MCYFRRSKHDVHTSGNALRKFVDNQMIKPIYITCDVACDP